MKSIKMFVLVALAALVAMAFAGASTAMAEATVLCSDDSEACTEITHIHETSVGKVVLLSTIKVECDVLFLGDTLTGTSSPLIIHGTSTYTNCGSCTVAEENGPAEIKTLTEGHETAKVTGEGLVKVVCSGFISCAYNGVGLVATGKGPLLSTQANGEVTISGKTVNKEAGGFLCPANVKIDGTSTPLEAEFLKTMLCVPKKDGLYEIEVSSVKCAFHEENHKGSYELISE